MKDRFTQDELALAKSADLCSVAERLGYTVVRIGNYHSLKEMDSIRIYNRRTWCRFSRMGERGQGGSQIDFLIHFGGMNVKEAVFWLLDHIGYVRTEDGMVRDSSNRHQYHIEGKGLNDENAKKESEDSISEDKPFYLPAPSSNDMRARQYLTKVRGISESTVDMFIEKGILYESAGHHNVVFVGTDVEGKPRFASMRGTYNKNGKSFKGDVPGNDKEYGFHLERPGAEQIAVFEAAIDLMSYVDIYHDMESHLLALGMVSDGPLEKYLKDYPGIKSIRFCLDHDKAGVEATFRLKQKYIDMGYMVYMTFPAEPYKDMNEWLVALRGIGRKKPEAERDSLNEIMEKNMMR